MTSTNEVSSIRELTLDEMNSVAGGLPPGIIVALQNEPLSHPHPSFRPRPSLRRPRSSMLCSALAAAPERAA
jgi:hypothetical protein